MSVTTEGESTAEPSAGLRRASGFGPLVLRGLPLGPAWAGVGVFAVYLGLWLGIMNLIGLLDGFRLMISVPGHGLLLGQFVWESPLGWFSGVNALLKSHWSDGVRR